MLFSKQTMFIIFTDNNKNKLFNIQKYKKSWQLILLIDDQGRNMSKLPCNSMQQHLALHLLII